MIKIYGSPRTSPGRCFWLLEELGLAYEAVPLDMKNKEQKSPWYLALNPNGKVPTLVDGDFVIWESCAINHYLAEKYRPEWLGRTIEERAQVEEWTFWAMLHVQRHVEAVMYQVWFQRGDAATAEKGKSDVVPFLTVLEAHLALKEFMMGDAFTVADVNVGSVVNLGLAVGIDFLPYPNIVRWMTMLKARPAMQRLLAGMG